MKKSQFIVAIAGTVQTDSGWKRYARYEKMSQVIAAQVNFEIILKK